jgi:hypothetical protein
MSAREFEIFLARIYVDARARARFKDNPRAEARRAGLSDEECAALENADFVGLEMAARSFARKRELKRGNGFIYSIRRFLRRFFLDRLALFRRRST